MGIRGLSGYLKWKAPTARTGLTLSAHRGQQWAIDCSCILYRARAAGLSPLTVVASLLVRLKMAGITPIFIFDGKPPASKADVIDQRREQRETAQKEITALEHILDTSANMSHMDKAMTEKRVTDLKAQVPQVTSGDKDQIKQLLYGAGVLFVSASGEADDMLGFLARTGVVHAVLSTDMDMLARGVNLLITPDTPDLTVMTVIHTAAVLRSLGLTYEQFVDACVLMGTDYTGRDFKTTKPPDAVTLAKAGVLWTDETCHAATQALMGTGVTLESLLNEIQMTKWVAGAQPRESATLLKMTEENGWPAAWATWI